MINEHMLEQIFKILDKQAEVNERAVKNAENTVIHIAALNKKVYELELRLRKLEGGKWKTKKQ